MLKKTEVAAHAGPFAEPTPLGLIGLAVACAALTPIAFGYGLTADGFYTASMYCLFFGAGCQFLAGMMNFANKNMFGGTIFTAFAFNWLMNWWAFDAMAQGKVPNHSIIFAVEALFLLIFVVLTYGFGFFSKLLFLFLADIDALYLVKVLKALLVPALPAKVFDVLIAAFTVGLGLIALWIAFAQLINPTAGRQVFKVAGPMFFAPPKPSFDFSVRQAIFDALYAQWRVQAFTPMPFPQLVSAVAAKVPGKDIVPDLYYLMDRGALTLTLERGTEGAIQAVRLNAKGIDVYEEQVLGKVAA